MKKLPVFLIGLFLFSSSVYADSPLTSTDISKAYQALPIVQLASQKAGVLTTDLMDYLIDTNNPIEVKIAVINQLGWAVEGKKNAALFYNYLKEKKKYKNHKRFIKKGLADEWLCWAYLKAMDNYFNVDEAINYANIAMIKNPKSYTFNIITALIKAQKVSRGNWCEIYTYSNNVRQNKTLVNDMNKGAISIIFNYMDLYKKYCV